LDLSPTDKFNVSFTSSFHYYETKYSLQASLNTRYFTQQYGTELDWQLPANFFFSTDFIYTINSRRADDFNTKVPLWNASISKMMLRYNRGELKLAAYDLLNRNINVSRNASQNYIEDTRMVTLRQFFLLSFTYSLTKTGLNNAPGGPGIRIIRR